MSRLRALVGLMGLALVGCGEPGFGVGLTVHVDDTLDASGLAAITRLRVQARGDEVGSYEVVLDRAMSREERLFYRPGTATRTLGLTVSGEDGTGLVLAVGETGDLALDAEHVTEARATLRPPESGDVDAAAPVDLTSAPDMAILQGTAGEDVLVAGQAGFVRDEQFERFLFTSAADITGANGDTVCAMSPSATTGWTVLLDSDVVEGLATGGPFEHLTPEGSYRGEPADLPSRLGFLILDTSFLENDGLWIKQNARTAVGASYRLRMVISDPTATGSPITQVIELRWDGKLVASYYPSTQTWTNGLATPLSGNRITVDATVTAVGAAAEIDWRGYGPASGSGVSLDQITLTPVAADPGGTIAGNGGADLIAGSRGDDVIYGGAAGATSDDVIDAFVYSLTRPNGDDVIKDFKVGIDRLIVTDVYDTYNAAGGATRDRFAFGGWSAGADPDATRFPGFPTGANEVADSDYNLSFHDVSSLDSPNQHILPRAAADGSLLLRFVGFGGVALGSVTLEGVLYADIAGSDDPATLRRLMGSGWVDPAVPSAMAAARILYPTTDGFHAGLATAVVH